MAGTAFWTIGACRAPANGIHTVLGHHAEAVREAVEQVEVEPRLHHPAGQVVSLTTQVDRTTVPGEEDADVGSDGVLTLEAARRIAVRANPDIHAAAARLEAARARIAEARAQFYPTVLFTHTSARTFHTPASRNRLNTLLQPAQPVPVDIDTQSLAVTTLLNAIRRPLFGLGRAKGNRNPFSEHTTSLTASWTVFDGFIREAQVLAARHLRSAAMQSFADVRRLIIRAVDTAYYQVQLAGERLRIARADETFSREQYEEARKLAGERFERASRADVDNFRVRMLAAQADVIAAIGLRDTGRVVLAELMGRPEATLSEDIVLSQLTAEADSEMALPEVEPWIERALANRPDLLELEAILESEEQNVRAIRGLFSPTVALSGSWGFDRSSSLRYGVEDQSSAVAVDFRWELYTGGGRRAKVRVAESRRAEAAAALNRRRLAVLAEVRRAVIDLADAQEQIRLQRENLRTARRNRDDIEKAWRAGKETLTRLNEAQRDFIEADAGLALARIRLRQAWSDLYAAAGTD